MFRTHLPTDFSIDAKKVDIVVEEIKKLGGDVIGVAGDVAADDFPTKIVDATIQYVLIMTCTFGITTSYA